MHAERGPGSSADANGDGGGAAEAAGPETAEAAASGLPRKSQYTGVTQRGPNKWVAKIKVPLPPSVWQAQKPCREGILNVLSLGHTLSCLSITTLAPHLVIIAGSEWPCIMRMLALLHGRLSPRVGSCSGSRLP